MSPLSTGPFVSQPLIVHLQEVAVLCKSEYRTFSVSLINVNDGDALAFDVAILNATDRVNANVMALSENSRETDPHMLSCSRMNCLIYNPTSVMASGTESPMAKDISQGFQNQGFQGID